jgi:hypothetical protein
MRGQQPTCPRHWQRRPCALLRASSSARATLDEFLAALASPPPNTRAFAVEIPITDPGNRNVE